MGDELAGFVSASGWGVLPNTSGNMSPNIQNALSLVASGATLYFPPGTYLCSGTLVCDRAINIYAVNLENRLRDIQTDGARLCFDHRSAIMRLLGCSRPMLPNCRRGPPWLTTETQLRGACLGKPQRR